MDRRKFIITVSSIFAGAFVFPFLNKTENNQVKKINNEENPFILRGFNVNVASHCNLNCKGCDTYSPLSGEEFLDYKQYIRDLKKIVRLAPERNFDIGYLGGEPLINPEITKIINNTRKISKHGEHVIITNALNLNTMSDSFWKAMKENDVKLYITKYPINLDRTIYEKKAKEYGIDVFYHLVIKSDVIYDIKTRKVIGKNPEYKETDWAWDKNIVDIKGTQDYIEKKNNCPHPGGTRFPLYARGNIYYCSFHAYFKAFRDYFKLDMPMESSGYIKVADVKDIKEIDDFLAGPQTLCRYCGFCHESCHGGGFVPWDFSKRDISEWT